MQGEAGRSNRRQDGKMGRFPPAKARSPDRAFFLEVEPRLPGGSKSR